MSYPKNHTPSNGKALIAGTTLALCGMYAQSAKADTIAYWKTNATATFQTAGDWSTGAEPTIKAGDDVVVGDGGGTIATAQKNALIFNIGTTVAPYAGSGTVSTTMAMTVLGLSTIGDGTDTGTLALQATTAYLNTGSLDVTSTGLVQATVAAGESFAPITTSTAVTFTDSQGAIHTGSSTGNVEFDAGSELDITDPTDASFTLANYAGSLTGVFTTVTFNGTTEFTNGGTTGPDVTLNYGTGSNSLITVTVAPEPASLALLSLGSLGALLRRRRRNRVSD